MNITTVLRDRGVGVGKKPKGTAIPSDVRAGETFMNDAGEQVGTLPDRGNGGLVVPGTGDQLFSAGIYNTDIVVAGDLDLVSGNIKAGADIFGVPGKASVVDTTDANAAAANILSGKTAYVNGDKLTGNIPVRGNMNGTFEANGTWPRIYPPEGYYDGTVFVNMNEPNLISSNIRAGKSILGVAGNMVEGIDFTGEILDTGGGYPDATADDNTIVSVTGAGWIILVMNLSASSQVSYQIEIDGKIIGTPSNTATSILSGGEDKLLGYRFNSSFSVKANYSTQVIYSLD